MLRVEWLGYLDCVLIRHLIIVLSSNHIPPIIYPKYNKFVIITISFLSSFPQINYPIMSCLSPFATIFPEILGLHVFFLLYCI